MTLPGKPLVWSPHGASDTLDSSTAFPGSMLALQNLIPDPSTRDLWQCRPAALSLAGFAGDPFSSGFSSGFGSGSGFTASFISALKVIGTRAYGMVSTTRNPGHDEPFVFDIPSATFITISGVTNANTPVSPATTGPWTPPSLDIVGAKIVITHPGFTGAAGAFFGVIDISDPAAPAWSATNTTVNALAAPPTWVVNFNGRACFLVNPPGAQPAMYMTDVLAPTVVTDAGQIVTFDDNVTLTCAGPLGLQSQLGGIVQALMVFKGVTNIFQITGDFSLGNLSKNSLNVATGTLAPNSLAATDKGLAFMSPEGLRVIGFDAGVSDPIGQDGSGVTVPFIYSVVPSRMCAAYNANIYRVQTQNGNAVASPQQQWWFDFGRGTWSGPHTQAASLMSGYNATFIVTLQNGGATLFQSDVVQNATSTYTEVGAALQFNWQTPMLPDTDQMAEVSMTEATVAMALTSGNTILVSAVDQESNVFDTVSIVPTGTATLWGAFTWGQALWQGAKNALYPRRLNWHFPIVFRRMGLTAVGACSQGVKIGRLHLRYQVLGYLQEGG